MIETWFPPEWAASVAAMQPEEFWLAALFMAAVAFFGLFGLFRLLHRARIVEDTPTSKVRSAAQGYVELIGTGRLMAGEPIRAPLTGSPCIWYRYKVERREHHGKRESWKTVRRGVSGELFLLDDGTGRCVIDPEGAEVTPSHKDVWYGNGPSWSGPPVKGALRMIGGDHRFTEERMHPDEPLYAIGLFKTVGGIVDMPGVRDEQRQLLAEWKRDRQGLLRRFDHNGDGQIDPHEWESARNAAEQEVARTRAHRPVEQVAHLLVKPEDREHPFMLSVIPQDGLVRRLKWLAAGSLGLFLVTGAVASWLFAVRFGG